MNNITDKPLSPDAMTRAAAIFAARGHLLDEHDRAFVATVLASGCKIDSFCSVIPQGSLLRIDKYRVRDGDDPEAAYVASVLWNILQ